MPNRTFLDTAFAVAVPNRRDQHHGRAVELAREYMGRPILTTDAVLVEVGNALSRNFRPYAVELIGHLMSAPNVEVVRTTPDLFDAAFELYRTHDDKAWGLTDCMSFVVMRQYGAADALTHDQHFVQAGFQALMR